MTTRQRKPPEPSKVVVQRQGNTPELNKLLEEVNANFNSKVIIRGDACVPWKYIPTGVSMLDIALLGGIPEDLLTILFGWESSGKSTVALKIAASAQKKYPNSVVAYIDLEGTYDALWAEANGVDPTRIFVVMPETGEQAVDLVDGLISTAEICLIVVDSLAAITPSRIVESSAEDTHVAVQSRLISVMMAKLVMGIQKQRKRGHKITVVAINQFRNKIGVIHGDNRVMPGGNALRFSAACMIELKNKEVVAKDSRGIEMQGLNEHAFSMKKCKTGVSLKSGEFKMVRDPENPLGMGFIDDASALATFAKKIGLITGGGSSWRIAGIDHKFGKLEEITNWMYAEPDNYMHVKRAIIANERTRRKLPPFPPDNYL